MGVTRDSNLLWGRIGYRNGAQRISLWTCVQSLFFPSFFSFDSRFKGVSSLLCDQVLDDSVNWGQRSSPNAKESRSTDGEEVFQKETEA